jgi:hypothetical protein
MTMRARLAVGLTSMAGFTVSGGAAVAGVIGPVTTLVLMGISLGIYMGALMQGEDARWYLQKAPSSAKPLYARLNGRAGEGP